MIIMTKIFFAIGLFFMTFGVLGLIRFPDIYTRLHPAGKAGTAGVLSIFIGLICYTGWSLFTLKILLIALFIILTSPVTTHLIARGAIESKIIPWTGKEND
ncbi:MAG: monovalent cation/H(+) antiporter subunit G [bacterium]